MPLFSTPRKISARLSPMAPRLAHLILANLVLFAQFISPMMQICHEENGEVCVELLSECSDLISTEAAATFHHEPPAILINSPCLCSDIGIGAVLSNQQSKQPTAPKLKTLFRAELPNACELSELLTRSKFTPFLGAESPPWLEHGDVLAKHHSAHAVVMNC